MPSNWKIAKKIKILSFNNTMEVIKTDAYKNVVSSKFIYSLVLVYFY